LTIGILLDFQDLEDDDQSYFIFDNSWGTGWAEDNHYGPGRGLLPFSYVRDSCTTRFAHILLDALPVDSSTNASITK
jgi:hypothetical protein